MEMFFAFLMTIISIAGTILMIMIIIKGINRGKEIQQEMYLKTLEKGVYDPRLIEGRPGNGMATLGWGIFFASVGVALFISFIALGIIGNAMAGSLVPFFIGIGLIVFYVIRRKLGGELKENGEPVKLKPGPGDPVV